MQPRSLVLSSLALALAVLLMGITITGWRLLLDAQERLMDQAAVMAVMAEEPSPETVEDLLQEIRSWPETHRCRYLSPEEALERFISDFPEEAATLDELNFNPLPGLIEVAPRRDLSESDYNGLIARLDALPGVEDIMTGQWWLDRLDRILWIIEFGGLVLSLSVGITVILVVMTTLRTLLALYRRELDILAFIGAGFGFAVLPFVLCGAVIGVAGSLLGGVAGLVASLALPTPLELNLLDVLPAFVTAAFITIILAVIGSFLAVRSWRDAARQGG